MKRANFWTCKRVRGGVRCNARNPNVKRLCIVCGAPRPARRQPTHMRALAIGYDEYVLANGGDQCGICLRVRGPARKLDRDHDHKTGKVRGVLCPRCNKILVYWMTPEWLRAAADYLERAAA